MNECTLECFLKIINQLMIICLCAERQSSDVLVLTTSFYFENDSGTFWPAKAASYNMLHDGRLEELGGLR